MLHGLLINARFYLLLAHVLISPLPLHIWRTVLHCPSLEKSSSAFLKQVGFLWPGFCTEKYFKHIWRLIQFSYLVQGISRITLETMNRRLGSYPNVCELFSLSINLGIGLRKLSMVWMFLKQKNVAALSMLSLTSISLLVANVSQIYPNLCKLFSWFICFIRMGLTDLLSGIYWHNSQFIYLRRFKIFDYS